jgi:hypothetical protein
MKEFYYAGGATKSKSIEKFFLFINAYKEEMFLTEGISKGYVQRRGGSIYRTDLDYVKIFYKSEGAFGHENLYQSFFFQLDSNAHYEYSIQPPAASPNSWGFRAKGKFMEDDDIKEHFSGLPDTASYKPTSFFFYMRQTPLSNELLRQMVSRREFSPMGIIVDPEEHFRVIR